MYNTKGNMQHNFLKESFTNVFCKGVHNLKQTTNVVYDGKVEFEGDCNWDIVITEFTTCNCVCNWEDKIDGDCCDCKFKDDNERSFPRIYVKLQPSMGDDYLKILKKMKTQITQTQTQQQKDKSKELKKLGFIEETGYCGNNKDIIKKILDYKTNDVNEEYRGCYVLLLQDYHYGNTNRDQMIAIFKNEGIKVMFLQPKPRPIPIIEDLVDGDVYEPIELADLSEM